MRAILTLRAMLRLVSGTINDLVKPLVWMLGLFPPVLLNAVTAFMAGLFIVFVFGFGIIATKAMRSESPIICLSCNDQ